MPFGLGQQIPDQPYNFKPDVGDILGGSLPEWTKEEGYQGVEPTGHEMDAAMILYPGLSKLPAKLSQFLMERLPAAKLAASFGAQAAPSLPGGKLGQYLTDVKDMYKIGRATPPEVLKDLALKYKTEVPYGKAWHTSGWNNPSEIGMYQMAKPSESKIAEKASQYGTTPEELLRRIGLIEEGIGGRPPLIAAHELGHAGTRTMLNKMEPGAGGYLTDILGQEGQEATANVLASDIARKAGMAFPSYTPSVTYKSLPDILPLQNKLMREGAERGSLRSSVADFLDKKLKEIHTYSQEDLEKTFGRKFTKAEVSDINKGPSTSEKLKQTYNNMVTWDSQQHPIRSKVQESPIAARRFYHELKRNVETIDDPAIKKGLQNYVNRIDPKNPDPISLEMAAQNYHAWLGQKSKNLETLLKAEFGEDDANKIIYKHWNNVLNPLEEGKKGAGFTDLEIRQEQKDAIYRKDLKKSAGPGVSTSKTGGGRIANKDEKLSDLLEEKFPTSGEGWSYTPSRQAGGPVMTNQPYVVGEGGKPEMFIPNDMAGMMGAISPNTPISPTNMKMSLLQKIAAALDNSGVHAPPYMQPGISPELKKQMLDQESFRGYDSPWPYCSEHNEVYRKAAERLEEGGPVTAGKPVVVGEGGKPELYVPNSQEDAKKKERAQQLGVARSPEDWVWVSAGPYSDYFYKPYITEFADKARKSGIDPNDFLALGVAESGLGNFRPSNPFSVDWGQHFPEAWEKKVMPDRDTLIDFSAKLFKEGLTKYPKDRIKALQAYSGLGKINEPGDYTELYKRFGKQHPQGKKVDYLSKFLKSNPDIQELIKPSSKNKREDISMPEARQEGGPVTADKPYIVGEGAGKEGEVFIPKQDGFIVPNYLTNILSSLLSSKSTPQIPDWAKNKTGYGIGQLDPGQFVPQEGFIKLNHPEPDSKNPKLDESTMQGMQNRMWGQEAWKKACEWYNQYERN